MARVEMSILICESIVLLSNMSPITWPVTGSLIVISNECSVITPLKKKKEENTKISFPLSIISKELLKKVPNLRCNEKCNNSSHNEAIMVL